MVAKSASEIGTPNVLIFWSTRVRSSVRERGGRWNPVFVDIAGTRVRVIDAVELEEGKRMPGESAAVGDLLHLGCEDGVVVLRTRSNP